jgi:hypothetical protein
MIASLGFEAAKVSRVWGMVCCAHEEENVLPVNKVDEVFKL